MCTTLTKIATMPRAWNAWGCFCFVAIVATMPGCTGSTGSQRKIDSTLQRHVKYANQAFSEGQVERAITEYRRAIRRAWAMDDPYESGTAAYNLAACLTSDARSREARDWLLDARAEFQRAGTSAGNAWLLEAKIALHESRFEDVHYLVQRAACTEPPCQDEEGRDCCGDRDPCDDRCVTKIPCLGPKLKKRRSAKDCEDAYQAEIHLVRARAAAEQYDIPASQRELACACKLAEDICSYDLHAEFHNVAALIHLAKGEYLQAGRHLDQEAENLRWAGNYREISSVLELASAAYQQAEQPALAADRLCRVARVLYGRGDVNEAWKVVQLAVPIAESACSETTKVRLALLANEILLVLSEQGDSPPELQPEEEDPGMLAPANSTNGAATNDAALTTLRCWNSRSESSEWRNLAMPASSWQIGPTIITCLSGRRPFCGPFAILENEIPW